MIAIPMRVNITEAIPMSVSASEEVHCMISSGLPSPAPVVVTQEKTVDAVPEAQTIVPDEGCDAMTSVTVSAMPSAKMKSGGGYSTNPTMTLDSETGAVNGRVYVTYPISPIETAGYATTNMSFRALMNGSSDLQLPTVNGGTFAPSNIEQTLVEAGKFTLGDIKVSAMPPWNYLGDDAEFVSEIYPKTSIKLKDTSFNGWTPSTTAKTIVTSSTLTSKAFTANFAEYEYLLRWRWSVDVAYKSGATLKIQIYRPCGEVWQWIGKRPSSLANIGSETFNGNACVTYFTAALLSYYTSSGSMSYTWSASYGLYASVTACTFASSTADSTTVTPKTPTWNARCSTTYMSTTRATELDQDNTTLIMRGELWRLKKKGTVRNMLENCVSIYNDHLNP